MTDNTEKQSEPKPDLTLPIFKGFVDVLARLAAKKLEERFFPEYKDDNK